MADLYCTSPGLIWPIPPTSLGLGLASGSWNIGYNISARTKKTFGGSRDELPIIVTTYQPTLNPGPPPVLLETRDSFKQYYTFTAEGVPRALTVPETLKEKARQNAKNHRLRCSLHATPSTAMIAGQPFKIGFTLRTDNPGSNSGMPMPEFQLKDYAMSL